MAFGEGGDETATAPLIPDHPKHLKVVRSGNAWTAAAHVITAVIGSGVLSLAWSMAQLGWVAGPGMMLVFASVTALQSTIFADCYRSPDPELGPHRNRTYAHAVERNLVGNACVTEREKHTRTRASTTETRKGSRIPRHVRDGPTKLAWWAVAHGEHVKERTARIQGHTDALEHVQ